MAQYLIAGLNPTIADIDYRSGCKTSSTFPQHDHNERQLLESDEHIELLVGQHRFSHTHRITSDKSLTRKQRKVEVLLFLGAITRSYANVGFAASLAYSWLIVFVFAEIVTAELSVGGPLRVGTRIQASTKSFLRVGPFQKASSSADLASYPSPLSLPSTSASRMSLSRPWRWSITNRVHSSMSSGEGTAGYVSTVLDAVSTIFWWGSSRWLTREPTVSTTTENRTLAKATKAIDHAMLKCIVCLTHQHTQQKSKAHGYALPSSPRVLRFGFLPLETLDHHLNYSVFFRFVPTRQFPPLGHGPGLEALKPGVCPAGAHKAKLLQQHAKPRTASNIRPMTATAETVTATSSPRDKEMLPTIRLVITNTMADTITRVIMMPSLPTYFFAPRDFGSLAASRRPCPRATSTAVCPNLSQNIDIRSFVRQGPHCLDATLLHSRRQICQSTLTFWAFPSAPLYLNVGHKQNSKPDSRDCNTDSCVTKSTVQRGNFSTIISVCVVV